MENRKILPLMSLQTLILIDGCSKLICTQTYKISNISLILLFCIKYNNLVCNVKKNEIWLCSMTKTPILTVNSKTNLPCKLLKQGYLVERLKSSFRKFLWSIRGSYLAIWSPSRILNGILTLDQQWLPDRSDFPQISWPWYRVWPSPNYEWFPWSICNKCVMQAGNAYPSGHLVPFPFLGLDCASIVETRFLELVMSLLDFSPWIPLRNFSILLTT